MNEVFAAVRKTIWTLASAASLLVACGPSGAQYGRPMTPPIDPNANAHVTMEAKTSGPWWIGSSLVPVDVTLTNLTNGPLLVANFTDARYANLYLTTTVRDDAGNIHYPDFPIPAAVPPQNMLVSMPKIASYPFSLSGQIGQQYFLRPGKYTVDIQFHVTNPPYKASATAALEVRDIHDYLAGKVIDIKAVKTATDEQGLVKNDVTGHIAIASPYPNAYWAVYWRDEFLPVIDKYADDRRLGYTDIPPIPAPIRSGMRYLQWLGPADKDTVPTVNVSADNDITVTYGAPTKRLTIVQIPKFMGPLKMVTDGNAPLKVTPSPDAPIVGRHRIEPAGGAAGSISGDENGVAVVVP